MTRLIRPIPIYTTPGDLGGFLVYPYVYNSAGEWIGWVTLEKEVYSVLGYYVGYITNDPRILRKRSYDFSKPQLKPPRQPKDMRPPATVPLPPMMSELTFAIVDVLEEEPERLPTMDTGDLRQDMD